MKEIPLLEPFVTKPSTLLPNTRMKDPPASIISESRTQPLQEVEVVENGVDGENPSPEQERADPSRSEAEQLLISHRRWELGSCAFFLLVALIISEIILGKIKPYQRPIPYQYLQNARDYVLNLTNDQTFDGDTISDAALYFLSYLIPLAIQEAVCYYVYRNQLSARYYNMHATICMYLVTCGIVAISTESVKVYVGYLRPIFYQECVPDANYQYCTEGGEDFRKSFPSGHASTSFSGLLLFSLFFHTAFGLAKSKKEKLLKALASVHSQQQEATQGLTAPRTVQPNDVEEALYAWQEDYVPRLISVASLLPMLLALFIAASRVHDNKHFPADVVGGAVLGSSIAVFVHSLWF